jgi:hypothetical protein
METNLTRDMDIESASALQSIPIDTSLNQPFSGPKQELIAIVGMAVNMPGAADVTQLWEILANGSDTVDEVHFFSYLVIHLVDLLQH